jgi:hypothetical protein
MAEGDQDWEGRGQHAPPIPLPPRLTVTEKATWVVYGLVAVLLIAIPLATRSFSIPDMAAWILLVATVALAAVWHRRGTLHGPEWLRPDDYERYLKDIQRMPTTTEDQTAPPRLTEPPADRGRSGGQPPPP